jgi:ABC-type amino acid transport substrate-binding protein
MSDSRLPQVATAIAALALILASVSVFRAPPAGTPEKAAPSGLIDTLDRDNVIRAGYGVFPPFTQENVATGEVTGVSVDVIKEIARQIGARVEWRRLNWNTMGADLKNGTFDVVADAIFMTPQRGREFTFSDPYLYYSIGIGVVRRGETRFSGFDDISRNNVTVAVGQGTGEEAFVRARAPGAMVQSFPLGQDTASSMNAVLTSRADIAISNLDDAKRFVAAHSDSLVMLWADDPPAYIPGGFILRFGDRTSADFLNVSLRNLRSAGVLNAIAARYGSTVNLSEPRGR